MYDEALTPRRKPPQITKRDRTLIDDHIAAQGVTLCPPSTHAQPEWKTPRLSWRQQMNIEFMNRFGKRRRAA